MKRFLKARIVLILIVVLGGFLRFYLLGQNPPSLNWDELAFGYNAYSIGLDGRDEFGRFLPLDYIESFGDFKPPLYAYLDILPVKIFGLNSFAVRFPSALFGTLTVVITYFLVKELFSANRGGWDKGAMVGDENFSAHSAKESKLKNKLLVASAARENFISSPRLIALISSFLLAISPWHIMLSRAAFEANVASFLIILGVWLFLLSIRRNARILTLSAVSFALSLYTFNSARVVSPVLVASLALIFAKKLRVRKKEVLLSVILGLILVAPIFRFLLSPQANLRFEEVNIFSDISVVERSNEYIANDDNALWSKILHNRRVLYSLSFARHYLDHFDPDFLFISGDFNPRFSTQDVGELYLWELPFFIAGAFLLFKKRQGYWYIVPIWLLIGILPAATARETPHALRIESTLPTWQIITAIGVGGFMLWVSNFKRSIQGIKIRNFLYLFLFAAILLNFLYFQHGLFLHYPREYSQEWQYGYKEAVEYAHARKEHYDKVYVTTALGRPYINFLFYSKHNPSDFRKSMEVQREALGFVHVNAYDKYIFAKDLPSAASPGERALFIDTPSDVPSKAKILKEFKLLNGQTTLVAYEI